MISAHVVWGDHGEDTVAQRRHVVTLWHLIALMDIDCNGVLAGT